MLGWAQSRPAKRLMVAFGGAVAGLGFVGTQFDRGRAWPSTWPLPWRKNPIPVDAKEGRSVIPVDGKEWRSHCAALRQSAELEREPKERERCLDEIRRQLSRGNINARCDCSPEGYAYVINVLRQHGFEPVIRKGSSLINWQAAKVRSAQAPSGASSVPKAEVPKLGFTGASWEAHIRAQTLEADRKREAKEVAKAVAKSEKKTEALVKCRLGIRERMLAGQFYTNCDCDEDGRRELAALLNSHGFEARFTGGAIWWAPFNSGTTERRASPQSEPVETWAIKGTQSEVSASVD
jgi:hypothetical protein